MKPRRHPGTLSRTVDVDHTQQLPNGDIVDLTTRCEVFFSYDPGDPGCHTFRNGDPGYPPTSPEIEIEYVHALAANHELTLSEEELDALVDRLFALLDDEASDAAADADDYPDDNARDDI